MQRHKKHLTVIQNVVKNTTCFTVQAEHNVNCNRKNCDQWINNKENNNCVLIAASRGRHTLHEIGAIYGLTRMRICQIEKNTFEQIKKLIN